MRRAFIVQFISKYSIVAIQFVVNVVLARLISPQDFGIVAIVGVFSSFFLLLSDMGLGPAIVQYKELDKGDINAIYSFSVYVSVILALLFGAIGYGVSVFFHNEVYVPLCAILSLSVLFSSLNTVPNALLMREQRFKTVGIRNVGTALICGIIEVVLAVAGFRYYAVVVFTLIQALFRFMWNRLTSSLHFSIGVNLVPVRKIFKFSVFQLLFGIINYFCTNTDTLMVGKTMGDEQVGYYNKAYQLITYPTQMFSGVITPILHPILSNYQNDKEQLYLYLIRLYRIMLYVSIIITCILFSAPYEIVCILYGNSWVYAVGAVQILSISIVAKFCTSITGSFYQALGRTDLLFKIGVVNALIIVSTTICGVMFNTIVSVACGVAVGYSMALISSYYYLIHGAFEKEFVSFIRLSIKPIIIFVLMISTERFIEFKISSSLLSLVIKSVILIILYGALLIITGEINHLKGSVSDVLGRAVKE